MTLSIERQLANARGEVNIAQQRYQVASKKFCHQATPHNYNVMIDRMDKLMSAQYHLETLQHYAMHYAKA